MKQDTFGSSDWISDIFDSTGVTLWLVSIMLLCLMAFTFFKRAHMLEFIGVFLDQPMPRNLSRPFLALTLGTAFILTLMVKSTIISHRVKPLPWKGPDDLQDLVSRRPGMKLLVRSATKPGNIIKSHLLYKSHPEKFIFRNDYLLRPAEVKGFLRGQYAILEGKRFVL